MTVVLVILKLVLFTALIIGPVFIGRELFQAMRGQQAAAAAPTAAGAEDEAA